MGVVAYMDGTTMGSPIRTRSETELNTFFEHSPLGMAEVDLAGRFLRVNETLCNMTEYSETELLGMTISDITHPEDIGDNLSFHPRAISGDIDRYHLEKRYLTKSGETIWVLLTVIVLRDDAETPRALLGQVMDISEQVRGRKALELSESRFRAAFENSPIAMDIVDLNGFIVEVSPSLCEMLGYSESEMVGKDIAFFSEPGDMQQNLRLRHQLATGEIPFLHMEKRYRRKNGDIVDALLTVSLIRDADENPLYYIGQMQDITERRINEEAQRRAQDLSEALNRIDVAMTSSLELDDILSSMAKESRETIGCNSMLVCLFDGSECEVMHIAGIDGEVSRPNRAEHDSHHIVDAMRLCGSTGIDMVGEGSVLSAPLVSDGKVIGGMAFICDTNPDAFDRVLEGFAARLATSVTLAVKNSRMYTAERDIADTLQSAVLQLPNRIPGCEFAHYYQSATKTARVGGDFYDLFELDGGRIGIIIGDVSGKGLEAAALTVLVKNTVKAYAHERDSPSRILTKTNEVAFRASPSNTFVTLFVGILDMKVGTLQYCNAGHPPPLVVGTGGDVRIPPDGCPAAAMFQGIEYVDSTIDIEPDDLIVCFTDGVTEARRGGSLYGTDRLTGAARSADRSSPQIFLDAVLAQVLEFAGGSLSDDVALLVVRPSSDQ